jgi:hypothetical protein
MLDFKSAPKTQILKDHPVNISGKFSNMAARAHNVFWLVEILKIFLLETTEPIELTLQEWSLGGESWWPSWISDRQTIHKFSTGPPNDHSSKVTIQLA